MIEARPLMFVLVILPLADRNEITKMLRIAHRVRQRYRELKKAWDETVARLDREAAEERAQAMGEDSRVHENRTLCRNGLKGGNGHNLRPLEANVFSSLRIA